MKTEFVKYNRERLPLFQTETTIVSDVKGHRYVRKRSLTQKGKEHVIKLSSSYDLLITRLKDSLVPRPSYKSGYVIFDFISGTSIEEVLMQATVAGDRSLFRTELEKYVQLLHSYGTFTTDSFSPTGGLEEFFSVNRPIRNEECLKVANLDLTFDNIIIDPAGKRWITDYEWVYDSPIPVSFLIFRSLYVFYLKHSNYEPEMMPFEEALGIAGVDFSLRDEYVNICESFIDHVFGKSRQLIIPIERMQPVSRYLDTSNGRSADGLVQKQNDEIMALERKLTLGIEQQKSIEARHAQEIRSLEQEIANVRHKFTLAESELTARTHDLDYERALSKELNASLISHKADLSSMAAWTSKLESELGQQRLENSSLSDRVEIQKTQIGEAHDIFNKLNVEFNAKQAELMTMSDWAFRMKQRLEFIDSKPLVRKAERYFRLQGEAADKLRSEGIRQFAKAAMAKAMPRKAKHWIVNQNPADHADLVKSIESNSGKVIIVFPIIPWEFRWQRPQQIVSRFAKNGYTVIFASMNISAKGRTFKNVADAGNDVKLGKLGENIFQIWLSSEGKVNMYHDKLTGHDITNLELGIIAILQSTPSHNRFYLVQFPGWTEVALSLRKKLGGKVIFDCMDDHSGFTNNTDDAIKLEGRLMEKADLVVATSQKLFEKSSKLSDRAIMVKNGTDFDFFNHLEPNGQLDRLPHPIIGYYGAISDWFDTDLVEYAAVARPDWSFVLIGSTVGCNTSRLEKLANVHLLGEKPYQELPGFLYYFDVCTIPFKIIPLTLATNPVKFYEYLSSGKPMVAVKLPELLPHQDLCYLAGSKEEFVEMIVKALGEKGDESLIHKRVVFAKDNSWDRRFHDILNALDEE